jgi:PTS system nitrogen regulatory IIA component
MKGERRLPGLEQAIQAGGVHYGLPAASRTEAFAALVERMSLPPDADRRALLSLLLDRESLGSTAVGDGVALPHVRNPAAVRIPAASVTVGFLEGPVEFGALDGRPVHTLLAIISPAVRTHLRLLSLVSFGLRQGDFRSAILNRGTPEAILAAARAVDEAVRARAEAAAPET